MTLNWHFKFDYINILIYLDFVIKNNGNHKIILISGNIDIIGKIVIICYLIFYTSLVLVIFKTEYVIFRNNS